jgi:hypothetical protein
VVDERLAALVVVGVLARVVMLAWLVVLARLEARTVRVVSLPALGAGSGAAPPQPAASSPAAIARPAP